MTRVVLISGGSRGLGKALVDDFLDDTEDIVATFSRSKTASIEQTLADPERGERFHFRTVDMADPQAINEYLNDLRREVGPVTILINNAGIALNDVLALQPDEDVERLMRINLQGTILLTKGCVRHMLTQQWGRIVNVSSIVGLSGYRGLSVYATTKAGLDGFTRSLARELGGRQITVNSVAPGFLDTDMTHSLTEQQRQQILRRTPLGRLGRPEDVVPLVRFLCSEEACFITGQTIVVDGGITV